MSSFAILGVKAYDVAKQEDFLIEVKKVKLTVGKTNAQQHEADKNVKETAHCFLIQIVLLHFDYEQESL
jgi:hypothetical protein